MWPAEWVIGLYPISGAIQHFGRTWNRIVQNGRTSSQTEPEPDTLHAADTMM